MGPAVRKLSMDLATPRRIVRLASVLFHSPKRVSVQHKADDKMRLRKLYLVVFLSLLASSSSLSTDLPVAKEIYLAPKHEIAFVPITDQSLVSRFFEIESMFADLVVAALPSPRST